MSTSDVSKEYKEVTSVVLFRGLKPILMNKRDEIPEDIDPKTFVNQFVDNTVYLILSLKFSTREHQQANVMEYDDNIVASFLQSNHDLETLDALCDLSEDIGATLLNEGMDNVLFGFEDYLKEFAGVKTELKVLLWKEFSGFDAATNTTSSAENSTPNSV